MFIFYPFQHSKSSKTKRDRSLRWHFMASLAQCFWCRNACVTYTQTHTKKFFQTKTLTWQFYQLSWINACSRDTITSILALGLSPYMCRSGAHNSSFNSYTRSQPIPYSRESNEIRARVCSEARMNFSRINLCHNVCVAVCCVGSIMSSCVLAVRVIACAREMQVSSL